MHVLTNFWDRVLHKRLYILSTPSSIPVVDGPILHLHPGFGLACALSPSSTTSSPIPRTPLHWDE